MIAWLWNLLVGQFCRHRWEIIKQGNSDMGGYYDLQCKKCGTVKSKYV